MPNPRAGRPQSPFPGFDVRIDPWAIEYGAEMPAELGGEPADADDVDVSIERGPGEWAAITPARAALPQELVVIDGVRRMEARLVVTRGDRILHGALGAYAVGAVRCRDGRAAFGEDIRERLVIFGAGEIPPAPIAVSPDLIYVPRSVPEEDPDAPLRGLHHEMRAAEEQFARRLAADPGILVVTDGPLSFGDTSGAPVVGFIKRLFRLYLGAEHLPVLRALPCGARTPVFLIRGAGRFSRYSWFTRLAGRLVVESDFTGLVRLEVAAGAGADEAIRLADLTTSLLPRFVPSRTRDPRAPQNLVPIGALEAQLRRGLGDPRLIQRRLATRLARELMND